MSPDNSDPQALQTVLQELAATIRSLPQEQQLDAFLASCASLLKTLSEPTIVETLQQLRERFPRDDNEVVMLLEGHLAMRQLLTA